MEIAFLDDAYSQLEDAVGESLFHIYAMYQYEKVLFPLFSESKFRLKPYPKVFVNMFLSNKIIAYFLLLKPINYFC